MWPSLIILFEWKIPQPRVNELFIKFYSINDQLNSIKTLLKDLYQPPMPPMPPMPTMPVFQEKDETKVTSTEEVEEISDHLESSQENDSRLSDITEEEDD